MIRIKNAGKVLKIILPLAFLSSGVYFLTIYSKIISEGIKNGINLCVTTLVPSLFMFMILSDLIANSKALYKITRLFEKPFERFAGLPSECIIVLLMSLIGGYPVGAKCTLSLYKSGHISKIQAEKLSLIAVSSGFGFVTNYVSLSLFQNRKIGYTLMISQFAAFIINIILCSFFVKTDIEIRKLNSDTEKYTFVDAVTNGTKATINMCAMVILFSGVLKGFEKIFCKNQYLCDVMYALCEVTNATNILHNKYPLYIISFIIGFGGLCVHFQIFSILREIDINKCLFFSFRIIAGISASITTYILLKTSSETVAVFSTVKKVTTENSHTVIGSIALILTGICFLSSLNLQKHIRR